MLALSGGSKSKPIGQVTRGKTAPNRLRQTDVYLAVAHAAQVRGATGVCVDLGYGVHPVTTVETLHRLRRLNPGLRVVGVEIDRRRVTDAEPYAEPGLEFRFGGFNLPLLPGERVSFIRAFNVLRQYDESAVAEALAALAGPLTEGGLIIEGTCDPPGRLLTFNLFLKQGGALSRTGFVLAPRLSGLSVDFDPREFRAVLPKNFIHHAEPGGAVDCFFAAWHASWQAARALAPDARGVFMQAALRLADGYGYSLDRRPALLRRGFLCLGAQWPVKNDEGVC